MRLLYCMLHYVVPVLSMRCYSQSSKMWSSLEISVTTTNVNAHLHIIVKSPPEIY